MQSLSQSPQALWPAVDCQVRLWGTGISLAQDFCGKTMQAVTKQPIKNLNKSPVSKSLSWQPTADELEPEDFGSRLRGVGKGQGYLIPG